MRRMTPWSDAERGGVAVLVAMVTVVLLGFAALAVDAGILYSERAQLQSGADSAALMVAQKCARNAADTNCSSTSTLASELANKNAVDGMSNIKSIALDKPNRTATVTTGAKETGGATNSVSLFFARILGFASSEVSATSRVEWGTPYKGLVILPLAIGQCAFNLIPGSETAPEQVLDLGKNCGRVPGGFGWIKASKCSVSVTASQWLDSDNGASANDVCSNSDIGMMNDQTVLFPIYDATSESGSNAQYHVTGFAAFHVSAYRFPNWYWPNKALQNNSIKGHFVKYVSLSQALELGNAPDYGTAVVRLTIGAP